MCAPQHMTFTRIYATRTHTHTHTHTHIHTRKDAHVYNLCTSRQATYSCLRVFHVQRCAKPTLYKKQEEVACLEGRPPTLVLCTYSCAKMCKAKIVDVLSLSLLRCKDCRRLVFDVVDVLSLMCKVDVLSLCVHVDVL